MRPAVSIRTTSRPRARACSTATNMTTNGLGPFSMRPKKSMGSTDRTFVIASRRAASTPFSSPTSRATRFPLSSSASWSTISLATGKATSDSTSAISRSYRTSSSLSSLIFRPESPIGPAATSASASRRLGPVVEVLHGRALGLRPKLQAREPLTDRIRGFRDRLDPRVETFDLLRDVVVDDEVGADRDERPFHVLRFGDQKGVRPDRDEDLGPAARLLVLVKGLPGPHVVLEGHAHEVLLLPEGLA